MSIETAFGKMIDQVIDRVQKRGNVVDPFARYLHLSGRGRTKVIRVFDILAAVAVFEDFRDYSSLGASDMGQDCGKITDERGNELCRIAYNGRVVLPNGSFLDGMDGREWLAYCTAPAR